MKFTARLCHTHRHRRLFKYDFSFLDVIVTPQIIFSYNKVKDRAQALSQLALKYKVNVLVAVKSLPDKMLLSAIQKNLQGFDISNSKEYSFTSNIGFHFITNCPILDLSFVQQIPAGQYLISCNSLYYYQEILKLDHPFVLRLRSTDFLSEAQSYKSRFGLGRKQVLDLKESLHKDPQFSGFHFHHGSEKNTMMTYKSAISAIKNLISDLGVKKSLSINLGGGFAQFTIGEIEEILIFARHELSEHELYIEPGRYFTESAGSCFSQVMDIQEDGEDLLVSLNVSRESHLKWSRIDKIQVLNVGKDRPKYNAKRISFYGNTCYENDLIGINHYDNDCTIMIGDTVILSNVSGYSLAWNTSFNGIPRINFEIK